MAITLVSAAIHGDEVVFQNPSWSVGVPAGLAVGDLILIGVTCYNTQTALGITGFTTTGPLAGGNDDKAFLYKIADAADVALSGSSGSWTMVGNDGFIELWAIAVYRGVNTASPFQVTPTVTTTSSTTVTAAAATSTKAGVYVAFMVTEPNSGAFTPPGGITMEAGGISSFSDIFAGVFDKAVAGAGSTGPFSGSIAVGFQWATWSAVLNPLDAAGADALFMGNPTLLM